MKKKLFITDCGTYSNEILVAINCDYEDIVKYLKKVKVKSDFIEEAKDKIIGMMDNAGFVCHFDNSSFLVGLKLKTLDWEFYEVLLHECCHVVQFLFERRKVVGDEAFAYQLEYIFKTIRRKIHRTKW